jgi:hypothetical protein
MAAAMKGSRSDALLARLRERSGSLKENPSTSGTVPRPSRKVCQETLKAGEGRRRLPVRQGMPERRERKAIRSVA